MFNRIVSSTSMHKIKAIRVREMDYLDGAETYSRVIEIIQNVNGQDVAHEITLFSQDADVLYLDFEG